MHKWTEMTLYIDLSTMTMSDLCQPLRTWRRNAAREWLFPRISRTNVISITNFGGSTGANSVLPLPQYSIPKKSKENGALPNCIYWTIRSTLTALLEAEFHFTFTLNLFSNIYSVNPWVELRVRFREQKRWSQGWGPSFHLRMDSLWHASTNGCTPDVNTGSLLCRKL